MNVVITGASSGLGAQLMKSFIDRNHNVIGTSHDREAVDGSTNLMYFDALGWWGPYHIVAAEAMERFKFKHLHLLINNAGTNAIRPFESIDRTFVQTIFDVNFMMPVFMTQAFLPYLKGVGTVINIISDAAYKPMRHSLAYNCSKAALDMATKQMARELTKPYNISIFGVRPGKMHSTKMSEYIDQKVCETRGWTPEQAKDYYKQNSVSGLEADPEDVAEMIYHLATVGGMHEYMSGACIDLVG
jgi:NAD(P)-dependent dehydrogenase (short-subunit alcohol dehydrogenase family)